ncbi:zinc transporter ZIP6-like [Dendronephthya gigantea]|uniref:zinc transporter ZIP6-like n=1 Tax=Dendronephthya gigantea TaxID=151771 RepID=UPI001069DADF|nr:zinc transporter ZIP6-like [Dendronephthya gigantea]
MFSYSLFLVLFSCNFFVSLRGSSWNEISYKNILTSLNVTELNLTTLDVLLENLRLRNCSRGHSSEADCRHRCLTSKYLFERHEINYSENVSARKLAELSTSLLYFMLPKNSGVKECQNGDDITMYKRFLLYYQTKGRICLRLLDRILRSLKEECRKDDPKQRFSAVHLFALMNFSEHKELDEEQFSTISIMIISNLLNGSCMDVPDSHDLLLPCRSYFTSKLFEHFGTVDGRLTYEKFELMLKHMGLGNNSEHHVEEADEHDDHKRKKRDNSHEHEVQDNVNTLMNPSSKECYSADDLALVFSINKSIGIDSNEFNQICPALIEQLESKSCVKVTEKGNGTHTSKYVWLYGFVSVLLISLLSLAGIAVIPTMKGNMYKKIIIVLVGLAIGTLTGDALFHLIPHAAGFHASSHGHGDGHDSEHTGDDKAFLWKFLVVASGVYGFFLFETFTHLFLSSSGHGHSHNIEHTRKHSPFERNNSCRTVERHEMRLASSTQHHETPAHTHTHDTTQVIFNRVSGKAEEKALKSKTDDQNHDDNIPSLLKSSSHGSEKKKISSVGWMIIIGDTIHNITDGIAIGAAFTQDVGGGLSTSIAVFCHELPHELGDFAVLVSSGMTIKQAMLANFLSACSSFIGLVIGILIGQQTEEGNQWIFAVMGGMFLYIALVDMLPELMHSEELGGAGRLQIFLLQNIGILLGFVLMLLIAYFEEDLVISE